MSTFTGIANFQMSGPFLVWAGRSFKPGRSLDYFSCEEGRSFEGGFHLGQGAFSDNYGTFLNAKNLSLLWLIMFRHCRLKTYLGLYYWKTKQVWNAYISVKKIEKIEKLIYN